MWNYIWVEKLAIVSSSFIDVTVDVPFVDEVFFNKTLIKRSIL